MSQRDTTHIQITRISKEHVESFYQCLDSVASERRYLGLVKAPPLESTRDFVQSNIRNNIPQYVAVEGNKVIGWCDIAPNKGEGFTHCGTLGMGVIRDYRGKGIGTRLIEEALYAKEFGFDV